MNFEYIKKHPDLFTFTGLFIVFCVVFISGIGSYPLMDIDETRYASMAHDMFHTKDFMTLYLNGEYFFEKPPLYFWLECMSFAIFGHVNEFTVRFPVSVLGILSCFMVYFTGKKVISRNFGAVSALVLATSVQFFILSKFAILDIVLCFCTTFSIYFGFMTLFCQEKNKKYFWWLFYIFSGLAVLAKGIPGFVLPFGTMFFSYIAAKKFRELFKPVFLIPGTLMFLAIVLPWHILMLKTHNPLFFDEYIMKHHLARFTTSADLGRKQPFYFFIPTLFVGFLPWIIPVAVTCHKWGKDVVKTFKNGFVFEKMNNTAKFVTLNAIAAVLTFLFFSASSTKLITYILPIYPFLACLTAKVILDISEDENWNKVFNNVSVFAGIMFIIAGLSVFSPIEIQGQRLSNVMVCCPVTIFFGILLIILKDKKQLFLTTVLFFTMLSTIAVPAAFKYDYLFGQNDLMEYAKEAKENGSQLASFGFGRRFSLNYYYDGHVIYEQFPLYDRLNNLLNEENTVIVIKNIDSEEYSKHADFVVIHRGTKYSLIKGNK